MSSVTVAGLEGGGIWRSMFANVGERTTTEPLCGASWRVIQSAPPPLLSGNLLDLGVPCALLKLYSELIGCVCDSFGNVMKNQAID